MFFCSVSSQFVKPSSKREWYCCSCFCFALLSFAATEPISRIRDLIILSPPLLTSVSLCSFLFFNHPLPAHFSTAHLRALHNPGHVLIGCRIGSDRSLALFVYHQWRHLNIKHRTHTPTLTETHLGSPSFLTGDGWPRPGLGSTTRTTARMRFDRTEI